jgi:large subunit ribosomal protein L22
MEARATAKYLDISPRKIRLVAHAVRGRTVQQALAMLQFMPQKGARYLRKLIQSAVANAENNYAMDVNSLYIATILVNQGPTQRRYRPRAHGRVSPIRKRSSHVTAIVAEKEAR